MLIENIFVFTEKKTDKEIMPWCTTETHEYFEMFQLQTKHEKSSMMRTKSWKISKMS